MAARIHGKGTPKALPIFPASFLIQAPETEGGSAPCVKRKHPPGWFFRILLMDTSFATSPLGSGHSLETWGRQFRAEINCKHEISLDGLAVEQRRNEDPL